MEEKRKNMDFSSAAESLGITIEDLQCIKGLNPMDPEVINLFKTMVNEKLGTNIPMSGVLEQAQQEYESIPVGDKEASAAAFVRLRELQRDEGDFHNSGYLSSKLLATDPDYQEAFLPWLPLKPDI